MSKPESMRFDRFGGIAKLIEIIRYVHHVPYSTFREIMQQSTVSEAGFFRHKKYGEHFLGVKMESRKTEKKHGYVITDYGLLNQKKL
jgi:hypothetical protein